MVRLEQARGSRTLHPRRQSQGVYNQHADLLDTFQLILSNFTNPIVAPGSNVCFDYDNMCWTTGDLNGVGGFTNPPSPTTGNATVGVNRGNGVDYFQLGRFGENNSSYDGPFGVLMASTTWITAGFS